MIQMSPTELVNYVNRAETRRQAVVADLKETLRILHKSSEAAAFGVSSGGKYLDGVFGAAVAMVEQVINASSTSFQSLTEESTDAARTVDASQDAAASDYLARATTARQAAQQAEAAVIDPSRVQASAESYTEEAGSAPSEALPPTEGRP